MYMYVYIYIIYKYIYNFRRVTWLKGAKATMATQATLSCRCCVCELVVRHYIRSSVCVCVCVFVCKIVCDSQGVVNVSTTTWRPLQGVQAVFGILLCTVLDGCECSVSLSSPPLLLEARPWYLLGRKLRGIIAVIYVFEKLHQGSDYSKTGADSVTVFRLGWADKRIVIAAGPRNSEENRFLGQRRDVQPCYYVSLAWLHIIV
jgi:hypothetical protein